MLFLFWLVINFLTILFSGAMARKLTPYKVSIRVVKTFKSRLFVVLKFTVKPIDFPIQVV